MEETYKVRIRCLNCGERKEVEIPKGTTIHSFLNKTKETGDWIFCDFCGCRVREDRKE